MTGQRDAAIQEQCDQAQHHRDQAVACLEAADAISDLLEQQESSLVQNILLAAISDIDVLREAALGDATRHAARADVLRLHAQASAKGAPYAPVPRLARLTAVRVGRYDREGER